MSINIGCCDVPACGLEAHHDGAHRSVEAFNHWRPVSGKRCRAACGRGTSACGSPSVVEVNRGRRVKVGDYEYEKRDSWWAYCPEHNYGRVVDGNRVVFVWETHPGSGAS